MDFDYVTLSSLNRHATATLADVGTPKVRSIERTLKSIANWITVDACVDVWKKEEGGHYLRDVDWVVGMDAVSYSSSSSKLYKMLSIISRQRSTCLHIVTRTASR